MDTFPDREPIVQVAYLRWKKGEPRESRVFPSLDPTHPGSEQICPACLALIGTSQPVQLLAIGPDSEGTFAIHNADRWYSALAVLFHARCLGTEVV
jgi:hypothetical protein